jgi:hypothetical protein
MNSQTPVPHTSYALSAALRNIATNTFNFELRIAERPEFKMLADFVPLGTVMESGMLVTLYRKTISTVSKSQKRAGLSSTVTVDLVKGMLIGVEVQGLDSTIFNSVALPATARAGQSGKYFEHSVTPASTAPPSDTSKSTLASGSRVGWSLEALADGTALWCTNIYATNAVDIENSECFKINSAGEILGFAIRSWAQVPVRGGEPETRLVILKSY